MGRNAGIRALSCLLAAATVALSMPALCQNIPHETVRRQLSLAAFRAFAAKLFPDAAPEVLVADVECKLAVTTSLPGPSTIDHRPSSIQAGPGSTDTAAAERYTSACLRLELDALPRDIAGRNLPAIAGGFGFGAHVVDLDMITDPRHPLLVRVVATVDPSEEAVESVLVQRAANILTLYRILSPLAPKRAIARPEAFTSSDMAYLLGEVRLRDSGRRIEATLLAPGGSATPYFGQGEEECLASEVTAEGKVELGAFKGWERFNVSLLCGVK